MTVRDLIKTLMHAEPEETVKVAWEELEEVVTGCQVDHKITLEKANIKDVIMTNDVDPTSFEVYLLIRKP